MWPFATCMHGELGSLISPHGACQGLLEWAYFTNTSAYQMVSVLNLGDFWLCLNRVGMWATTEHRSWKRELQLDPVWLPGSLQL